MSRAPDRLRFCASSSESSRSRSGSRRVPRSTRVTSTPRAVKIEAYLQPTGPEFDLFAIDTDGTHLERLTFADGFDGFPVFSPDGTKLSFSSNRRFGVTNTDGKDVYAATGGVAGVHDTNVFLADWSEEELAGSLTTAAVPFERPDDLAEAVADVVAGDGIVAWVEGRSEWGPRALGHRSLLANPEANGCAQPLK